MANVVPPVETDEVRDPAHDCAKQRAAIGNFRRSRPEDTGHKQRVGAAIAFPSDDSSLMRKEDAMRSKAMLLAAAVLVVGWAQLDGEQSTDVRAFMRAKLEHSQNLLEGLTTEDYDLIAKNAGALTTLSQDTDWNVIQTAEYRRQSEAFRRNTEALMKAALAKKLDSATLSYVQVTLNCVECHKHVRDVQND